MFKFCKPNGKSFNRDYLGSIYAYDSGNDLVAICKGDETWIQKQIASGNLVSHGEGLYQIMDEKIYIDQVIADPLVETDWTIVSNIGKCRARKLRKALVEAFKALQVCERIVNG